MDAGAKKPFWKNHLDPVFLLALFALLVLIGGGTVSTLISYDLQKKSVAQSQRNEDLIQRQQATINLIRGVVCPTVPAKTDLDGRRCLSAAQTAQRLSAQRSAVLQKSLCDILEALEVSSPNCKGG